MRDRFVGKVSTILGYAPERVEIQRDRVNLHLLGRDGSKRQLATGHVIAATGFAPDVRRLSFLSPQIQSQLQTAVNTPVLSRNSQSTVPGLYFAGPVAANSFGPILRFIAGTQFSAHQIANHLARSYRSRSIQITSPAHGDSQAIARRRSGEV
jgi:thioredoxin reductase